MKVTRFSVWFGSALLAMGLWAAACSSNDKTKQKVFADPVTAATHDRYFPINEGVHKLECEACHGTADDFEQARCTSCHTHNESDTRSVHFNLTPNYVWADIACVTCHPTGQSVRFDHTNFFPIREGSKHVGITCAKCHNDPTDRHVYDCLTCHTPATTDSKHSELLGYERASPTCMKCHPESLVQRVSAHLPFHITRGFAHYLVKTLEDGGVDTAATTPRVACFECHPSAPYGKPFTTNFEVYSCVNCHYRDRLAPTHSSKPTYRHDNVTCLSAGCHQQGSKDN